MAEFSLETFEPRTGKRFEIESSGGPLVLTLEEATALPPSVRAAGSFRLLFRGPVEPTLSQGIHSFRQGEEAFDIFVVPLQPEPAGALYEAIFN